MTCGLTISPDGNLIIPAAMRTEIGLPNGGRLIARVENGALLLEPIDAAVRRAQELVRQYIPASAPLVDNIIAERHAAARHE